MIALVVAAFTAFAPVPTQKDITFLPPKNPEVKELIYKPLPKDNADDLRLCKGKVCLFYREEDATRLVITLPIGKANS